MPWADGDRLNSTNLNTIVPTWFGGGAVFDVTYYGAVGDGATDDTGAIQDAIDAASVVGGTVVFPAATYLLRDQITVAAGVTVWAYGTTLVWTLFGSSIPASGAPQGLTGNGVRMTSRTNWIGGHLKMDDVATPDNVSVNSAVMTGAFWNLMVAGHFNTATIASADYTTFTSDIVLQDVTLELVEGDGDGLLKIMGPTTRVRGRNVRLLYSSSDLSDKVLMECTWGAQSGGETYHPHDLRFENMTLTGSGDIDDATRGIHMSGCYDVKFRGLRADDLRIPFSWYIGDPGDPRGTKDATSAGQPNAAQAGLICTGLEVDGYYANNFSIAYQVIGDANGSTHLCRRAHDVRATLRNYYFRGQGYDVTASSEWDSNIGVFINRANAVKMRDGVITEAFDAVSFGTPPAPATVISITRSSQVATAVTSGGAAHNLAVGDYVVVNGVTETEYNGTFIVDSVAATDTFTYEVAGTPSSPASGSPVMSRFNPPAECEFDSLEIYNNSRNGIAGASVLRPIIRNCTIYNSRLNNVLSTGAHIRISPRGGVIEGNRLGIRLSDPTPYAIYNAASTAYMGNIAPTIVRNNQVAGADTAAFAPLSDLLLDGSNQIATGVAGTLTLSANRGDTSPTIVAGINEPVQQFTSALTENRTVTLSTTNAHKGARFRVVRTGLGTFTLNVGGLKTIPVDTAAFVDVEYDGSAWKLTGYGEL